MYNKWAKYTHKGITQQCDASPLKKMAATGKGTNKRVFLLNISFYSLHTSNNVTIGTSERFLKYLALVRVKMQHPTERHGS